MSVTEAKPDVIQQERSAPGGHGAALLFVLTFLYVWISVNPFPSLARTFPQWPEAIRASQIDKILIFLLFLLLAGAALRQGRFAEMLQPRLLLAALFGWMALASVNAPDPGLALTRLALAAIVCFVANSTLHLPRSEQQFARLLAAIVGIVLAMSYFGVVALPQRAIHQVAESLDTALAGDWRGLFHHKNVAAIAMALIVIIGLYLVQSWSRVLGWTIVAASLFFLIMTGGKTALAILPVSIVLAWAMERWPRGRWLLVTCALAGMAFLTVGTVLIRPVSTFIAQLGVDASFTGRIDIWRLAYGSIAEQPLLGFGYQSFWQSEEMGAALPAARSWAASAYNGHNAYLDLLLQGGVPGLALALIWLVVLPLRDIGRAVEIGNSSNLTRFFKRIWIFALLAGFMESIFLTTASPVWFMMLIAVFGLRLQASAALVSEASPARKGPAPDG